MEDYLLPLKIVQNKVRGLTGISWSSKSGAPQYPQAELSQSQHTQGISFRERCHNEGLSLEKVKFFTPLPTDGNHASDQLAENETVSEETRSRTSCDNHAMLELFQAVVKGEVYNGIFIADETEPVSSEDRGNCDEDLALAIRSVIETEKEIEKVLVVAWGSQRNLSVPQTFYGEPRVLCFSFQRDAILSTVSPASSAVNIGEKLGRGYNFEVPYGPEELSDADYLAVLHHLLLPVAYEYNPDLVVIYGETKNLNSAICAHLTASLTSLAHGKVATIVKEENQCHPISKSTIAILHTLTGQAFSSSLTGGRASEMIRTAIVDVLNAHRPLWKCLLFQGMDVAQKSWSRSSADDKSKSLCTSKDVLSRSANDHVAFIYDDRMTEHYSYTYVNHAERPERMTSIYHRMLDYGLIDRCRRIEAQMATKEQICMLHEPSYVDLLTRMKNDEDLRPYLFRNEIDSVSCCPKSYELSLLAAGSAIKLVDTILDGDTTNGIAVIRPPGHHAEPSAACGFCFFNNTALAAKHAIEQRKLSRVLIVDWDIHHGNGIQRMFLEDPRVLYISLHVLNTFPVLPEFMNSSTIGTGPGAGFNINIPWTELGMGDAEYLSAFFNIILPVAYEFQPELVLVACGFDGARGDPIGKCNVSPETYGHMASFLKPLANGRLGVILEGGYNLESVSYGMTMIAKALLGDPVPKVKLTSVPQLSAREDIRQVKKMLQPYWYCLQFPIPVLPSLTKLDDSENSGTLNWCPHLDVLSPIDMGPGKGVGFGRQCDVCVLLYPNACCLTCFKSLCFVDKNHGHSRQHYEETGHALSLHFGNLRVFCHPCMNWIEHPLLTTAHQRAHWERYGEHPCSYPAHET